MLSAEAGKPGTAPAGGQRRGWGKLYAVLGLGALLCTAGYRLGTTPALATLLQVAVALIILGLLAGWVRISLPSLLAEGGTVGAAAPPPFSAIRIRLRPQRVGHAAVLLSRRRRARALRLGARRLP
jgi:hypothetical protein